MGATGGWSRVCVCVWRGGRRGSRGLASQQDTPFFCFAMAHGNQPFSVAEKGKLLSETLGWTVPAEKRRPKGLLHLHQPVRSCVRGRGLQGSLHLSQRLAP